MKILKNKKYFISILIDFSFLVVLYLFFIFMLKKIQSYSLLLQDFGVGLSQFESIMQENMSMLDYNLLLSNLGVINSVIQKIFVLFLVLLIGFILLYCLFQGLQWSFILNNLKRFKDYIKKFCVVSVFAVLFSLYFLWHILIRIKPIFLNYFSGLSIFDSVIKVALLLILLLVLWYYISICYVLLSKNKFFDALKKTIYVKNLKSVFVYFVCIALIFVIFYVNLWFVLKLVLILSVLNYYRYYLVRILKI